MASHHGISPPSHTFEPWSYLTSYLRPAATEKSLSPRVSHPSSPPVTSDTQFEELRVIPKGLPRVPSMTSSGGDPHSPPQVYERPSAYVGPDALREPYEAVDRREYTVTWAKNSPFDDEDSGLSEQRFPQYSPPGHAAESLQAMRCERVYQSPPEAYWKTGLAQHGFEPYQPRTYPAESYDDPMFMPQLVSPETPYDVSMIDLQRIQELVRAEQLAAEQPTPYHSLPYSHLGSGLRGDTSHQLLTPEEDDRQQQLPHFSTFRIFADAPAGTSYTPKELFHQTGHSNGRSPPTLVSPEAVASHRLRPRRRSRPTETELGVPGATPLEESWQANSEDSDDSDKGGKTSSQQHQQQLKRKKISCNICWKSFSQTANLKAHLRIHTGEKPFQCAVCHQRFSQRSSVKTHMRIHSGERPFTCNFCQKSFYDSSTLIKHRRTHTGEKPYTCKICNHQFSQSGNLTRHYKLHTDADKS